MKTVDKLNLLFKEKYVHHLQTINTLKSPFKINMGIGRYFTFFTPIFQNQNIQVLDDNMPPCSNKYDIVSAKFHKKMPNIYVHKVVIPFNIVNMILGDEYGNMSNAFFKELIDNEVQLINCQFNYDSGDILVCNGNFINITRPGTNGAIFMEVDEGYEIQFRHIGMKMKDLEK